MHQVVKTMTRELTKAEEEVALSHMQILNSTPLMDIVPMLEEKFGTPVTITCLNRLIVRHQLSL